MKDPTLDMDSQSNTMLKRQSSNVQAEPRKNPNKMVRVAFGPDVETHISPRDKSPAPTAGHHHRSFTSVEHKLPAAPSSSGRPTSLSGGDSAVVVTEERPQLTSDRASDSGRPTAVLKRARSDYGPRIEFDKSIFGDDDEDDFAMRHGWQEEYTSSEYLKVLHSVSRINLPAECCYITSYRCLLTKCFIRTFTCISRRSVTKRTVFREILLEVGRVRTGV